jgi:hypothetical protein
MRWSARVVPVMLLVLAACDNKQDAAAVAAASASAAAAATAAAPVEAGKPDAAVTMPERPLPKPQTMVGSGMPIDVQQKAVMYMVAMRAPHLDDAPADAAFANDLANKLKPIALSMDTGGDKPRWNRVEVVATGRQIDILMSAGCDEKAPARAVVTRAGVPLSTLVSHGVLVVRCNDLKVQCLQSTRDPDDVLCTTAPRHK